MYDRDSSGSLDMRELKGFFDDIFAKMRDPKRLNQQAAAALDAIDRKNNGRTNEKEFLTPLKKS